MNLADLVQKLRNAGLRVATAESCTGGLVAAALTDIPGASDVVECGFVTYSNQAKISILGVRRKTLDAYGAVSQEVAQEMAEGALNQSNATLSVAVTGIAGPGGSEYKPEGRVCFALSRTGAPTQSQTIDFGPLGRENVRNASTLHALEMLEQIADSI